METPLLPNIDVADEFATVLMVIVKQEKRAAGTAAYFVKNPTASVVLKRLFQDERHTLAVKRAKNVLGWFKDHRLVRNWQKTVARHMQTPLLKRLKAKPPLEPISPLLRRNSPNGTRKPFNLIVSCAQGPELYIDPST